MINTLKIPLIMAMAILALVYQSIGLIIVVTVMIALLALVEIGND
jgi:hypothetical protein